MRSRSCPLLARADEVVGAIDPTSGLVAAGGVVASTDAEERVILRHAGKAGETRTGVRAPFGIDIGLDAKRRPTVVWITLNGRVMALREGQRSGERIARVPGDANTPAFWGTKVAYTRKVRGCDVLYVLDLRTRRTKRLRSPAECGVIYALDLSARWLLFASESEGDSEMVYRLVDEVVALPLAGGRSRSVDYLSTPAGQLGVSSIALDGDHAHVLREGARPDVFLRHDLKTKREVRRNVGLQSARRIAVTQNRLFYTAVAEDVGRSEALKTLCPRGCPLLESDDPFSGKHDLPPLVNTLAPLADDPVLSGRVTGRQLTSSGGLRPVSFAATEVGLLDASGKPTGLHSPVAADGSWSIRIPAGGPRVAYSATLTVPGAGVQRPLDGLLDLPIAGRITVHAERQADGRVRFQGTSGSPLPTRQIVILPDADVCQSTSQCPGGRFGSAGVKFDFTSAAPLPAGRYYASVLDDDDPSATRPQARSEPFLLR